MDQRYSTIAAIAATQHAIVSLDQLEAAGVNASSRSRWVQRRLLHKVGPRSFLIAGAPPTWRAALLASTFDTGGTGFAAGRAGCQLYGLDGFTGDAIELLSDRAHRHRAPNAVVRSTASLIPSSDLRWVDGIRTLSPERLIIDAPLFGFSRAEVENAIDSAIRLRLVSEQRLRTRVITEHRSGVNGSRALLDALVDTGGETRLERWFLRLCRVAGLPRPVTQRTYREGSRTIARVDAEFPGGLIVEVAGHGTHATRQQIAWDEERRTALTLRGKKVLVFTYDHVRYRPDWVASQVAAAQRRAA